MLARAVDAEAALVVNNGAAAVLLVLTALAAGKDVIVSRGELVEIGGGFRIPEVLAASGARLVEVGTTNRTRRADYQAALTEGTALLLKVHTSNYRITGFTEAAYRRRTRRPRESPWSSSTWDPGCWTKACPWLAGGPPSWLRGEPAVRQTLAAGAGLVTFSGDKLLGGPQAGIIAGRADLVERCRPHPLARALRPGGLVLEALQQVALAYLHRDAGETLPLWKMATRPVEELRGRAEAVVAAGRGRPGSRLRRRPWAAAPCRAWRSPPCGVAVAGDVSRALRTWSPPVIARVHDGRTVCDLRTVLPDQDATRQASAPPLGACG